MTLTLKQKMSTKEEIERKIYKYITTYLVKYLKRLYENIPRRSAFRAFQEELLKISDWNEEMQQKEYKKFCKWINKKYDLSEDNLIQLLNTSVALVIELIVPKKKDLEKVLKNYTFPTFQFFFYKCIKKFARHFYEHPKEIVQDTNVQSVLEYTIQDLVPLKFVVETLDNEEPECVVEYNFEAIITDSDDEKSSNVKIVVEKVSENNDNSLKYISSEEFDNEYYMSEEEQKNNVDAGEDSQLKHVTIHKKK